MQSEVQPSNAQSAAAADHSSSHNANAMVEPKGPPLAAHAEEIVQCVRSLDGVNVGGPEEGRLLYYHVLTRGECAEREWEMLCGRGGDDHGIHLVTRESGSVAPVRPDTSEPIHKVSGADCVPAGKADAHPLQPGQPLRVLRRDAAAAEECEMELTFPAHG